MQNVTENKSSRDAIYQAALLRFRPIMMTTMAAIFGALPLVIGFGVGSELRQTFRNCDCWWLDCQSDVDLIYHTSYLFGV